MKTNTYSLSEFAMMVPAGFILNTHVMGAFIDGVRRAFQKSVVPAQPLAARFQQATLFSGAMRRVANERQFALDEARSAGLYLGNVVKKALPFRFA